MYKSNICEYRFIFGEEMMGKKEMVTTLRLIYIGPVYE